MVGPRTYFSCFGRGGRGERGGEGVGSKAWGPGPTGDRESAGGWPKKNGRRAGEKGFIFFVLFVRRAVWDGLGWRNEKNKEGGRARWGRRGGQSRGPVVTGPDWAGPCVGRVAGRACLHPARWAGPREGRPHGTGAGGRGARLGGDRGTDALGRTIRFVHRPHRTGKGFGGNGQQKSLATDWGLKGLRFYGVEGGRRERVSTSGRHEPGMAGEGKKRGGPSPQSGQNSVPASPGPHLRPNKGFHGEKNPVSLWAGTTTFTRKTRFIFSAGPPGGVY